MPPPEAMYARFCRRAMVAGGASTQPSLRPGPNVFVKLDTLMTAAAAAASSSARGGGGGGADGS